MALIQLRRSRKARRRVDSALRASLKFPFKGPHIYPEIISIETQLAARHDHGTRRTEQLPQAIQTALERVIAGVTVRVWPQRVRQCAGAHVGAPERNESLEQLESF